MKNTIILIIAVIITAGGYYFYTMDEKIPKTIVENKLEALEVKNPTQKLENIAKNGSFMIVNEKEITLKDGISLTKNPDSTSKKETKYTGTYKIIDINGDGTKDIFYIVSQKTSGDKLSYFVVGQISSLKNYNGTFSALSLGEHVKSPEIYLNKKNNFAIKYLGKKDGQLEGAQPNIEIIKVFGVYENSIYEINEMDASWDTDNDGVNDCEKEASCDDSIDYSKPRI